MYRLIEICKNNIGKVLSKDVTYCENAQVAKDVMFDRVKRIYDGGCIYFVKWEDAIEKYEKGDTSYNKYSPYFFLSDFRAGVRDDNGYVYSFTIEKVDEVKDAEKLKQVNKEENISRIIGVILLILWFILMVTGNLWTEHGMTIFTVLGLSVLAILGVLFLFLGNKSSQEDLDKKL